MMGDRSSMASRSHSESDLLFSNSTGLADRNHANGICMETTTDIKGNKSHYKGIVSSTEVQVSKLPGELCKTNNYRALKNGVNASFCVLTEHAASYTGGLHTRIPLELFPLSSCPDRTRHVTDVQTLPLPLACPTCWSLQRLPAPRTPGHRLQGERRTADAKGTKQIKVASTGC